MTSKAVTSEPTGMFFYVTPYTGQGTGSHNMDIPTLLFPIINNTNNTSVKTDTQDEIS